MFGGCLHKYKHRISTIENDVVPNTVNWGDVSYYLMMGTSPYSTYTSGLINGISSSITLKVNIANNMDLYLFRKISNTIDSYSGPPQSNNFILTNNNDTFVVNNNQYVYFAASGNTIDTSDNISIKNNSSGDTEIDTFNIFCYDMPE